jgi:MFS family permease
MAGARQSTYVSVPSHPRAHRASPLRRALVGSTWEAILAMPLVYLNLPANLIIAVLLAQTLRVPPDLYGWLVSLPYWCNLLQLPFGSLLFARYRAKDVFVTMIWVNTAVWIAFGGVLVFFAEEVQARPGWWAGWFLFAAGMTTSLMAVAWTTYMQSWVPGHVRAVYFSRRNRWAQFSNLTFLLLAGVALRWPELRVIAGVILVSSVLRVISAVIAARNPAQGDPVSAGGADFAAQWRSLVAAKPFWPMVVFGFAWGAMLNGYAAFQPVFMLSVLGEAPAAASVPLALSLLFGALALPAWGKLIARFGAKPVLACAVPLWTLVNFTWAFLRPEWRGLLYPVWAFTGAINAGVVLAQLNLLMKLMPPDARGLAVGINTAGVALGTALAPIAVGQALAWGIADGATAASAYRIFFFTLPVWAVLVLVCLRRVTEPQSAPVEHALGAFRNVRTLAGALGLGFLAQTLFTPRGADRRSEY